MAKYGMAIDLSRCMGCRSCMLACKMENGTPANHFFMYTYRFTEGSYPNTKVRFMPRPCMHCETPACVTACKFDARIQWKDGRVMTDVDNCTGDRKCEDACPYGVNYFNIDDPASNQYLDWNNANSPLGGMYPHWHPNLVEKYKWSADPKKTDRRLGGAGYRKDTVGKCTFCVHRIEKGITETACQQTCPVGAIIFGDLDDASSDISKAIAAASTKFQLQVAAGTKPKVHYLNGALPSSAKPIEMAPVKTGVQKKGDPKLGGGTVPWK
jgi:Fe-S-cluster-containing dehydrogenase component